MASMREIFAAFVRNGRWDVAEQLCRAVIDFVKDDAELVVEARGGLEFCLWSMGRGGEAWALHQQNRAAGHADAVVGMQFSCFAHDYEGRNVGKLGYRGHQVVAEAVLRLRPVATTMRVLDLGPVPDCSVLRCAPMPAISRGWICRQRWCAKRKRAGFMTNSRRARF